MFIFKYHLCVTFSKTGKKIDLHDEINPKAVDFLIEKSVTR